MKLPRILLLPVAAAALAIAGCQRVTDADKEAAVATVKTNIEAMQKKDIEGVAATIHPQSPYFEGTKRESEELFKHYDLDYTLHSAAVESVDGDQMRVRFEQDIVKRFGPATFQNSRQTGVYVMRRDGKVWKLWATEKLKSYPLEAPAK